MMKPVLSILLCSIIWTCAVQATSGNPYAGAMFYVPTYFRQEVQSTIVADSSVGFLMNQVINMSTSYWLDKMAKINNLTAVLTDARNVQHNSGSPVVVTVMIYNLPDRDCSAGASNGEITCADANCTEGIMMYETEYIDPIREVFEDFSDLRIVAVIEPDALPNMATNLAVAKCAQGEIAYFTCINYAVTQFSDLDNVYIYLDAGHGGWLGWDSNRASYISAVNRSLGGSDGYDMIRGFASNTANYQPLGSINSTNDPCGLAKNYNNAIDEVHYIYLLDQNAKAVGMNDLGHIIDTGRNGVPDSRESCSNWCNIKKAGLGVPPTSNTSMMSGINIIDAFYWTKNPGESDGTSNNSSSRYTDVCTSVDAFTPAPEAGLWFSSFFINLAQNSPYLDQTPPHVGSASVTAPALAIFLVCLSLVAVFV